MVAMATYRSRRVALFVGEFICAGLVLTAVFQYIRRPTWAPGLTLQRAWARRGVERPNVVLITVDTTRADRLHCYGDAGVRTPALDARPRAACSSRRLLRRPR
jgi:hypothetical protein